jgi:hypothetical protein
MTELKPAWVEAAAEALIDGGYTDVGDVFVSGGHRTLAKTALRAVVPLIVAATKAKCAEEVKALEKPVGPFWLVSKQELFALADRWVTE